VNTKAHEAGKKVAYVLERKWMKAVLYSSPVVYLFYFFFFGENPKLFSGERMYASKTDFRSYTMEPIYDDKGKLKAYRQVMKSNHELE